MDLDKKYAVYGALFLMTVILASCSIQKRNYDIAQNL